MFNNKSSRIISALLLCVLMLFSAIFTGCAKSDEPNKEAVVVAESENFVITDLELNFFLNYNYMSFMSQYGSYASMLFNLDTTKDLKDQEFTLYENPDVEFYSWFDYFMDQAKTSAEELLILQEEAKTRNIGWTEEDENTLKENLDSFRSNAESSGMSLDEYLKENFGETTTEEVFINCMRKQMLASKTYQALYDEPEYTSDDYEKCCAEDPASYYMSDYKCYSFKADYDEDADDAAVTAAREKAKADADSFLAAITDASSFDTLIKKDLESRYTVVSDSDESEDENTVTESKLTQMVNSCTLVGDAYTDETPFGKWAYEKNDDTYVRKTGDTTVIADDDDTYTVYYILNTIYRDETKTVNARHILITVDSYDSINGLPDAEAKVKAEELLKTFNDGDNTEDAFAKLAAENTLDSSSKSNGGLYENIAYGNMVTEFNDWIFDSSRVSGDTGIVKTTYGYHIMYFVSQGRKAWENTADTALRKKDIEALYPVLSEKYPVTFNDIPEYVNIEIPASDEDTADASDDSGASQPSDTQE